MAVSLPVRPFLFTLDQISVLLNIPQDRLEQQYIYAEGRSIGVASRDLMLARNVAPREDKPDWRVVERELIRWMKRKGFKYYEPASFTH